VDTYIFDTKEKAQAALDEINVDERFPIIGRNAFSGELEPNKQKTLCWCDSVKERDTDKKYYFSRLPDKELAKLSDEKKLAFMTKHNPKIEKFEKEWVKEQLELV